ncbi:MAG: SurA N-terminal domain-containing protein [Geobacteraceae bacterium]|nr:SurA N-terminal domain-containing protein [Geobacteraceae bacterium]
MFKVNIFTPSSVAIYVALILLCCTSTPSAETISRIAAVVNDEIITTRQLDQRVEALPREAAMPREQVLQDMITDILIEQRAEEIGIGVSEEDIDRAVQDVEQQNDITTAQLEQALVAQGMTMRKYREQLRNQILRFKLTGIEVKSKADVTQREIQSYYEAHEDDFRRPAQIRLSRISIPLGSEGNETYAEAEKVRKDLTSGRTLDAILTEGPESLGMDGGDMGYFKPGELSPMFNEALGGLGTGEVTDILQDGDILHILRVEESTSGGTVPLEEVESEIAEQLRSAKMEEKLEEWREELRESAYIEVRL